MNKKIPKSSLKIIHCLDNFVAPFVFLMARIQIASIFWKAGISKMQDWQTTLYLFAHEYKIPFIAPKFAACSATFFELVCAIMIISGFGARVATIPLLLMVVVIEVTYLSSPEHIYWAIILLFIFTTGPSKISLDYFIKKYYEKKKFIYG